MKKEDKAKKKREPKKARAIVIPEDRPLTNDEFNDFYNHGIQSSIWYCTRFSSTEQKIKNRLYKKGYPKDDVSFLNGNDEVESFNLVDEVVEKMKEIHFVNDENFARSFIESQLRAGRGLYRIRQELKMKGIEEELINDAIDGFDDSDSLARAFSDMLRHNEDLSDLKTRQKVIQKLVRKGFSFHDINEIMDEYTEDSNFYV